MGIVEITDGIAGDPAAYPVLLGNNKLRQRWIAAYADNYSPIFLVSHRTDRHSFLFPLSPLFLYAACVTARIISCPTDNVVDFSFFFFFSSKEDFLEVDQFIFSISCLFIFVKKWPCLTFDRTCPSCRRIFHVREGKYRGNT